MVTDSEIVSRIEEILLTADLNITTTGTVRRQLEEEFGIDLTEKKAFIRERVDLFLETQFTDREENNGIEELEPEQPEGEKEEVEEEESKTTNSKGEKDDSEEDDDDEEEEAEILKANVRKGTRKKRSKKSSKVVKKRGGGGGFTKLCSLSPQLQKLTGVPEMARTEVVKQLWTYIKEKNLQDPKNKRSIVCDESLHDIFRVKSINMFQMNKALTKHIWPLDSVHGGHDNVDKEKHLKTEEKEEVEEEGEDVVVEEENIVSNSEGEEDVEETSKEKGTRKRGPKKKNKEVKKRGGGGGFTKLCSLSPQLQSFTGVSEMARTQVVKSLWVYIKEKDLQDPSNRKNILCDETLQAIFGVNTIGMFQMNKALTKHIWPLEPVDGTSVKSETREEKELKQEREEEEETVKSSTKKEKKRKKEIKEDPDEPKREEKRLKVEETSVKSEGSSG